MSGSVLLDQYRAGKRIEVWDQLRRLGDQVRNPGTYDDAVAVARETMQRVRNNVELLVPRLIEAGYRFDDPQGCYVPARSEDITRIAELEEKIGPIPISIRAFYEVVGAVNFCQSADQIVHWSDERREGATEVEVLGEEDPLYVLPLCTLHADLLAAHAARTATPPRKRRIGYARFGWREGGEDKWYCYFAPDEFHKANYSGGENYNLFIPDAAADFRIRDCYPEPSETENRRVVCRSPAKCVLRRGLPR